MIRSIRRHASFAFPILCSSLTVGGLSWPALKSTAGEITDKPGTSVKKVAKIPIDQAVTVAASDLGIHSFRKSDVTVEESTFADESIPFLRRKIMGQSVYRVVFHNVTLTEGKNVNPFVKTLVTFVSPSTGRLLKVTSVWPTDCPRIADQPGCAEEERQLGNSESYVSFPDERPLVSLIDALNKTPHWTKQVKQVHAVRVLHSCPQHSNRAVWIIYLRGTSVDPLKFHFDPRAKMADDAFNHMRNLVDSQTGKWIWADTFPQPPGPLEERY
jgi:hypothetical protein